ncbi:MAG TPA: hypothetical protein VEH05_11895, partial [Streptosporangiaceae bacterium]|nr:hypothetical protein [Streptosporangiaceae bacterium]
ERAAGVAAGRCRAVVRVPWDVRLADGRALAVATIQAYTALVGVLVSGLAEPRQVGPAPADAPPTGPAPAGQR